MSTEPRPGAAVFALFTFFPLCFSLPALAADVPAMPELPPAAQVVRVLRESPEVQAAGSQIRVEEAQRQRLEAGPHEWTVRLGGQQRRSRPAAGADERFGEWNAALERPVRLPGKAALDAELGEAGVAQAETAYRDALHEASRSLLQAWFTWLRENALVGQWTAQTTLLAEQARAVGRRQALGDAARIERLQAEAALAQAEAQRTQAELRQRTAAEDLRRRYPGLLPETPPLAGEPQALEGDEATWIARLQAHSHELALARSEAQRARLAADRQQEETLPDPSVGVQFSRERNGEERVLGAYVSIPLPGGARRASTEAARAQALASSQREAAVARRVSTEAAMLYHAAHASHAAWQSARHAAERLTHAADMTARGYALGEGSLSDVLNARRLAHEAQLAARLAQLDARERHYRLLLDAHRLWDFD